MERRFARLRLPVALGALAVIVYYTVSVALVPHPGFDWSPLPEGKIEVLNVRPNSPAALYLQDHDLILAIDGWLTTHNVDWRPLWPVKSAYTFTIQRDTQTFAVTVPVIPNDFDTFQYRMALHVVALTTWIVGGAMLLYATPTNREAWHAGFVILGVAAAMAAISASVYGVPGSATASAALIPVMGVGFAGLALLPAASPVSRFWRVFFSAAFAGALVLSALWLVEIYTLRPFGLRLVTLIGIVPGQIGILYGTAFLQANPLIVIGRYLRLPGSYLKQQLRILMICLLVAIGPMMLLSVLPGFLIGNAYPLGEAVFEVALFFLILLPASYGYVIYRHKYLGLDLFVTQTIALLIIGLVALLLYSLFAAVVRASPGLLAIEPLPSSLFVLSAVVLAPLTSRSSLRATQTLLYGRKGTYQQFLARLTNRLSAHPEVGVMRQGYQELVELLQIRQAALFLASADGDWEVVEALRVSVRPIPARDVMGLAPSEVVVRSGLEAHEQGQHALFQQYPWAEVLAPIQQMERPIGLLVLGQRIPEGAFDAFHVAFIGQARDVIGVAAQAIRLFEASLDMSRQLLQVRDAERTQLAAQIHDDPLQSITAVSNTLGHLEQTPVALPPEAAQVVHEASDTLRRVTTQLRDICAGLRPPVLMEGIEWVVKGAAYKFRKETQVDVKLDIQVPNDLVLSEEATLAIHHILTEALHNVRKHANANTVWVALAHADGCLRFSVADNGQGAALDRLSLADLVRARHYGAVGMFEWARQAKGTLAIAPRKGGGTVVTLTC